MQRFKKPIRAGVSALILFFVGVLLHSAYADKPVISLNSPVSFPVDI
ncbi:hypothetical protein Q7C_2577 [Methylophaga frappieri]|uniref:Uncharacterized protein n=1 Tax=Methylophaga frappieri (strain ATCC BAA-2434 / DSM 25690 / JAM7) TaxID=754477 RepID=I1YLA5_METFJ|nr:hypothetical protein [Methylophaga frappieri]AFJ03698.1 hypothetical protein Q7C_2577 [Methylophaga frappieri]